MNLDSQQALAAIRKVTLFSSLPEPALNEIVAALQPRDLAAGEILFRQGEPGDELVIVQSGQVGIFVPLPENPDQGQPIRLFQPGELLGEMAVIDQKPRSASARAEAPSRILTLSGKAFRGAIEHSPSLAVGVMAGLSDRIRYTTDFLGQVRQWVQRIAEGDYQAGGRPSGSEIQDQTLAALAEDFARMASRVQEREETLKKEVAQLKIEIDEARRSQEAQRIMGSDYYKSLKEKARQLREQGRE